MSYALIRAALRTRVAAVSGVGVVHSLIRHTADNPATAGFKAMFEANSKLNAWMITRRSREDELCEANSSGYRVRHQLEIEAIYSLDDQGSATAGSETVFQDLLDSVVSDLRGGDRTLGGTCITHTNPQIETIEHVSFYGTLAHRAIIALSVEEVS